MDFINEQHGTGLRFQFGHHGLQAFFEIAAIARAGQKAAHIQRIDGGFRQHFRHITFHNAFGQPFRNRGFAHARIADIKRIILGAAAKDLDGALDFLITANQRVNLALFGLLVQVHAVIRQRILATRRTAALFFAFLTWLLIARAIALRCAGLRTPGRLGNAMADEIHRIKARHVLQLQEIDRMGFAFRKQCHQHIGAGHFIAARRLHMDGGALHHALEASGGLGIAAAFCHQAGQILVQKFGQVALQFININTAGAEYARCIGVIAQGEQ